MSAHRLPAPSGARIDRGARIAFRFNDRELTGFAGDTLASALLANGVALVGRSFKLHRPRGIFSCGVEEPSGLVDVGEGALRTPNVRATLLELHPGLTARSVNCWPSVGFDLGALNGMFSALLPAGFYYKTFKWPNWHLFEPSIRRMAGFGRAPQGPDPDRYEEVSCDTDVLVVGGGLAGLAAAEAAARAGARTMLLTSSPMLGGALGWRGDAEVAALVDGVLRAGVTVLTRTLAFGVYDHNLVCARESVWDAAMARTGVDRSAAPAGVAANASALTATGAPAGRGAAGHLSERLWKIRARTIVAAAGALERPMLFPDNDRPGVMLAGAAEQYALAFGVGCGRRVAIAANSDSAYRVAASLRAAGIEVAAIIDCRASEETRAAGSEGLDGTRVFHGAVVAKVSGARAVRAVTMIDGAGRSSTLTCDALLSAGGHTPTVHLHSQAGGKLKFLAESSMFVPDGAVQGLISVGACAGVFGRAAVREHAAAVGTAIARGAAPPPAPVGGAGRSVTMTRSPTGGGKRFVDLQNDVTTRDVELAARENYRSVEHLKRYTTMGMGTDQGKTSNVNALALMGALTGREPAAVGTTRFRPPFAPVSLGLIAGRRRGALYRPLKRLPSEAWHQAHGAAFEQFGNWLRPVAYPRGGEGLEAAAQREASVVRRHAGILDGSPLGKLEVFGPDAAAFLDLMYVGTMSTLQQGQARYGVLCNEHGVLVDDGIVAKLGDGHYWVNTTSAGVERTAAAFEEWLQCEYTQMKVLVTPVSSRWGNITVAGPKAWQWLASCGLPAELAPSTMPHMSLRGVTSRGVPLRVLRASFSGELCYEINLPANRVEEFLERFWKRAPDVEGVLYGIEALEIMRTEKCFIHIGTDTDGTTLPGDVGLARGVERKQANFVGRRSLMSPAARDPARFQLVALAPVDGRTPLPVGGQIAAAPPPTRTEGHVTSSYLSPELGKPVALGMLSRGAERTGERVRVHHLGSTLEAMVVKGPFVDPQGVRLGG